ncbi:MAG TPA: hypothetical protein VJV21_07970 [Pyrinomonadaceae bacterium]|nr:hypothetical protein [Pyrinomonadaceae bacterium]
MEQRSGRTPEGGVADGPRHLERSTSSSLRSPAWPSPEAIRAVGSAPTGTASHLQPQVSADPAEVESSL